MTSWSNGHVGMRTQTSLSSDGRSSRTSGGSGNSESNYMNVVSDGCEYIKNVKTIYYYMCGNKIRSSFRDFKL